MNEDENRAAFEAWVKAPPFSRLTHRWREGVAKGQYLDVSVHLAWRAWCERGKLTGPVALETQPRDAGLVSLDAQIKAAIDGGLVTDLIGYI